MARYSRLPLPSPSLLDDCAVQRVQQPHSSPPEATPHGSHHSVEGFRDCYNLHGSMSDRAHKALMIGGDWRHCCWKSSVVAVVFHSAVY